jgi:hypothetical protein
MNVNRTRVSDVLPSSRPDAAGLAQSRGRMSVCWFIVSTVARRCHREAGPSFVSLRECISGDWRGGIAQWQSQKEWKRY